MPNRLLFLKPPLLPQSDDQEEHRRYRKAVANYHYRLSMVMAALIVFTAWALSPLGLARAHNVKPQIEAAITPVKTEVENLKTQLQTVIDSQTEQARRLTRSLSNTIAAEMRLLQSKKCKLSNNDADREWLAGEIERRQDEYKELRKEPYNIPNCAEL